MIILKFLFYNCSIIHNKKKSRGCIFTAEKKRRQYFAYLWNDFYFFSKCSRLLHFASWKLLLCRLVWVPAVSSSAAPSGGPPLRPPRPLPLPKPRPGPPLPLDGVELSPRIHPGVVAVFAFWHCRDPGDHTLNAPPFLKRGAHTCCRADLVNQDVG